MFYRAICNTGVAHLGRGSINGMDCAVYNASAGTVNLNSNYAYSPYLNSSSKYAVINDGGTFNWQSGTCRGNVYPYFSGQVTSIRENCSYVKNTNDKFTYLVEGKLLYNYGKQYSIWGDHWTQGTQTQDSVSSTDKVSFSENCIELIAPKNIVAVSCPGIETDTETEPATIDFSKYNTLYVVVNKEMTLSRIVIKGNYPYKINYADDKIADMGSLAEVIYKDSDKVVYKCNVSSISEKGHVSITAFAGDNNGLKIYEVYLTK